MKLAKTIVLVLFLFCSYAGRTQIKYEQQDKEILNEIFNQLNDYQRNSTSELIVLAGKFFMETPYVAHTLETEPEQMVINLRELDCTTYAENCLALARTIKSGNLSFNKFTNELTAIRYCNGIIKGYPSRLHYFSDWIYENDKKGLIKKVSKEIANTPYPLAVDFMSTHHHSYKQLKNNSDLIPAISQREKEINTREMFYVPQNRISEFESKMQEGDIIGICTSVKGLDIIHVGILVTKNGRIHLMHASSAAEKVIISKNTLEEYLAENKLATGIMIVRPI
ncbi:DUF1460 domain-containing protein [Prolixibacteraceae bacterium Z1-6]|uniref:DUF1460 domain-containing protein n=1 Tax=Draconibacterium aestuarii TaxID=2998507 RepID=A0A9X3FAB0_9BACT|nr:DUF1460 domain-containing protein [Prolixibacteraceae bacterium Z1-6]